MFDIQKLCAGKHRWPDGWICSKCGIPRSDWEELKKSNKRGKIIPAPDKKGVDHDRENSRN